MRAGTGGSQQGLGAGIVAVIAVIGLALGSAGGYIARNRAVQALTDDRDTYAKSSDTFKTRVAALNGQVNQLQTDKDKLAKDMDRVTAEEEQLVKAVQVTTAPKDVAAAWGKASMARNEPWLRALMTSDLAASFQFQSDVPDLKTSRFTIMSETKKPDSWVYVVRVWYAPQGQSEVGYTDSTLTVVKVGENYKVSAAQQVPYVPNHPK